jgi:hypothetical protein
VVPPPPPPAPPAKPKKFKFDREFGFCLCREVFEELIERLRFMKKNILRRENIPEGEHDRHISSSQLMLITKYLITSRQQIGEYEETAVVASINQIFLDKLTMEVKFFMKKVPSPFIKRKTSISRTSTTTRTCSGSRIQSWT